MSQYFSRGMGASVLTISAAALIFSPVSVAAAKQPAASTRQSNPSQVLVDPSVPATELDEHHISAAPHSGEALPTPKPVWTAGESVERPCFRSRRKLWQAGEGWMVKRVNVCP